jgi:tetratricopeptide (TPR) repeat protein
MLLSLTELNPAKALDLGLGLAKVGRVNGKSGLNLPMLYALIALLAQDEGRVSLTRSAMKNALEFWPTEPRWHALMARAYQLADDLPETDKEASAKAAIQHLQQAITMEPNHIPHYISLAEVHMGEDQFAEATETLQNATLVSAEHPEPWFYLANVHLVCGDLRQAAICADRAITLEPNKTRALLLRAEIALTADDAKSAYRLAEQAIDLQPDNPEILFMLSRGLEALDKPGQAIRTLEKAIALTKDNLPLQLERIRLLEGHKGTGAALSAFAPILKQRPDDPLLLAPLAEMLARGNHLEKAIETAQAALRSAKQRNGSPTNLTQEEQARLYLLLGKLEARLGLLDDAVQHLNTATKYAPNSFPAYLELGKVHHLRRENDLALTAFEQAIRISPNDSRPYYEAGMALHAVKDYKYAEEMLRYAANLNPSDIEIQRQLANLVALNLVHSRPTV